MSPGVRRKVVLNRWEIQVTRLRAESLQPPVHGLAVSWDVCLGFVYSARFWEGVVVGPGFRVAGRRQEVTAKCVMSETLLQPQQTPIIRKYVQKFTSG